MKCSTNDGFTLLVRKMKNCPGWSWSVSDDRFPTLWEGWKMGFSSAKRSAEWACLKFQEMRRKKRSTDYCWEQDE